tara:strand:- start:239 stop:1705 length:1467 start_codon:yes stop_codon:yes gene_type:complete
METKQFQNLLESIINLNEDHMKGKTVIVNGKRGVVGKEVSKDGQTEGDEFYRVKFEDGSVKDIPARDMEMAGNTKNKKQPSENEAEDIANESVELEEKKKKKGKHDCATHVEHTQYGEGQCIHSKHATPDENGQIAWYDVMFEHGIEKEVPTDSLKILVSEMHEDHEPEEGENLDELSNKTLGNYLPKASKSLRDGSAKHKGKRVVGMKRALDTIERRKTNEASSMVYGKYKAQNTGKQDRHGFDKYDISKGDKVISRGKTERQSKQKLDRVRQLQQKKANIKLKLGEGSLNELDKKTLRSYATKARTQITRDLYTDQGKHKPSTNRRAKGLVKAKERLGEGSLGYQKALRSKGKEKEGMRSGNKRERAMDFRRYEDERKKSNKRTHTEDYQCPKEMKKQNMKGAGIGIPAINNDVFGTKGFAKKAKKAIKEDMSKYDSYDKWRSAGFPKKKKKPMVKIKLNPKKKVGYTMHSIGPGGKRTLEKQGTV